jgi:phosphopantothenoylcysteine decarboxylase / phosphopantothenate---cysteine ligase
MAAAVADFRPRAAEESKIVREGSGSLGLELEPTEDVLGALAVDRGEGQVLVGFAAEHGGEPLERARAKLTRKGVDAIVANDVSDTEIGFDSTDNEVTIVTAEDDRPVPRGSKESVADAILDRIGELRAGAARDRAD